MNIVWKREISSRNNDGHLVHRVFGHRAGVHKYVEGVLGNLSIFFFNKAGQGWTKREFRQTSPAH